MISHMKTMILLAAVSFVGFTASACQEAWAQKREIEIKGPVANLSGTCPNLEFTVAALKVVTHGGTKFEDGTCADVRNGRRVEAKGSLGADGALVAREVDLE